MKRALTLLVLFASGCAAQLTVPQRNCPQRSVSMDTLCMILYRWGVDDPICADWIPPSYQTP